jgi:DNA-binding NarL/FixJ family response regulator
MSRPHAQSKPDPFKPIVNVIRIAAEPTDLTTSALDDIAEVVTVPAMQDARQLLRHRPFTDVTDVVMVEGAPSDSPTLTSVRELRQRGCAVVVVTPRSDELAVVAAIRYGAHGYVSVRQSDSEVTRPLPSTMDLSVRELAVLTAVADGASNADIGQQLGISALTVKSHLARVGHKLGTGDRAAMVARVLRAGLIY